jgi:hypothetical protein
MRQFLPTLILIPTRRWTFPAENVARVSKHAQHEQSQKRVSTSRNVTKNSAPLPACVVSASIFVEYASRCAMASIKEPQSVLAFVGLLSSDGFNIETIVKPLTLSFGEVTLRSTAQQFTHTTYYNKEMGEQIMRQWWVFGRMCDPAMLADMKHATNALEQHHLNKQGGRQVNIDPGIITMSNVVLASTKNYSHRIYLGKGIYAEVTLFYKGKTYTVLDWTYPDYKEPLTIKFFNRAREVLRKSLSQHV